MTPRSSSPALRVWSRRLLLACGVALALGYLPYRVIAAPSADRIDALATELSKTRAAIAELERDNAARRRVIEALKHDPGAIEDIARDELGMVYPGEIILRVDSEASR